MSANIVRAWIDSDYRSSLTAEQLASVPPNPVAPGEPFGGRSEEDQCWRCLLYAKHLPHSGPH